MQPDKTFPARKISKKNKAPALVSCTDVKYNRLDHSKPYNIVMMSAFVIVL